MINTSPILYLKRPKLEALKAGNKKRIGESYENESRRYHGRQHGPSSRVYTKALGLRIVMNNTKVMEGANQRNHVCIRRRFPKLRIAHLVTSDLASSVELFEMKDRQEHLIDDFSLGMPSVYSFKRAVPFSY